MRLIKHCAAAVLAVCTLTATLVSPSATADQWPSKPITLLVGFSAGGGADTLARLMARALEEDLGQPVVVENKAGGGGVVMATLLQRAPADGYTVGFTSDSTFDALPFIVRTAYQPDDFDYLATVTELQNALVAGASAPFSTWEEMLAYAREQGGLTFGSLSPITTKFAERLAKQEGIRVRTVPIKGGRQIITDVMGRHLDVGWSAGVHQAYLNDQGVKVIVAMNSERLRTSPDVPTIREQGYDRSYTSYFMLAAPKGIPAPVRDKLLAAIRKAATSKDVANLAEEKMKFPNVVLPAETLTRFIQLRSAENEREFSE
ncbi:tripartite tricarboxylate transporter substrate binding protein [Alcanivorax marinus]|uniref:Tripartite tricarboxylate transporter substrate binding protein n=1 Tax=Alloalcanivorax marinus TaxID=1177169 RepID=A0A9Q3ULK8_9GAMM|nr:tripartite tricarboxylate transporter substrate binding protein [Alloalcanivorax marinus]MBM7332576.1 tripartite tricarboxylate transporter substrate binding protein [Alloalcanivorax marinus]MCC4307258.1 tripartite tricarboxylate transporter substrate binding protein [Alloalcanivorax marinus]MCU5787277.1 recombinase A [Alloalcanivorax marinus]